MLWLTARWRRRGRGRRRLRGDVHLAQFRAGHAGICRREGNGDAFSRVSGNINRAKRRAPLLENIRWPSPAVAAARGERAGPRARVRRRGSGIDRRVKRGSRTHLPQEVGPGRRDRARILAPLVLEGLEVRGARAADELVLHLAVRGWRRMRGRDRGECPRGKRADRRRSPVHRLGAPDRTSRTPPIRRWRPEKLTTPDEYLGANALIARPARPAARLRIVASSQRPTRLTRATDAGARAR